MFDWLPLSSFLAFPKQLYAFSCGSFPSMNDYSNKIVSSWNVLPLGQFWSIYEAAHTVVIWNLSHIPGCFPFGCFGFVFFFLFSYDNGEVWLQSGGVEQDQLCLRLFSSPAVNTLCFSVYEVQRIGHSRLHREDGALRTLSVCCISQALVLQQFVNPKVHPIKLLVAYCTAAACERL